LRLNDRRVAIANDDITRLSRQTCEPIQTTYVVAPLSPTNSNWAQWQALRFSKDGRRTRP
jgi:hypothetical protein